MAAQNSRQNSGNGRNIMEGEEHSTLIKAEAVLRQELPRSSHLMPGAPNMDTRGACDHDVSTYSLCSMDTYGSSCSSTDTPSATMQPDAGDDCASIILSCLFCQFYDLLFMLPDTCESAMLRCCPTCQPLSAPAEPLRSHDDCNCNLELDCGLFDACHETGECLELAMEVSEICYH